MTEAFGLMLLAVAYVGALVFAAQVGQRKGYPIRAVSLAVLLGLLGAALVAIAKPSVPRMRRFEWAHSAAASTLAGVVSGAFLLSVGLLAAAAAAGDSAYIRAGTNDSPVTGRTTLEASGSATKRTQAFTVDGKWELRYSYACADGPGYFSVSIIDDASDLQVDLVGNEAAPRGRDTSYQHVGGRFYLDVTSLCPWSVRVVD